MSVLNLRRAYLQVRVHKSLWPYQTVILKGKRYCLSRMGFELNVAPCIMQAIVVATLLKDDSLAGNFYIHQRCLYQQRHNFRNQGEATFG